MAWRKILHLQKRKLPRRLVQKVLFLMKILKNFGLFLLFYGEHGEVSFLTSRIDYVTCLSLIRSTKISISAIRDPCYPFRRDPCLKSSGTILSKNITVCGRYMYFHSLSADVEPTKHLTYPYEGKKYWFQPEFFCLWSLFLAPYSMV